jgi:hypothetical protein
MSESYGLYGLIPHSRVLAFGVLVLVLSYWDWPGSRRKGIPPGMLLVPGML